MGELGVKTMIRHLRGQPIERLVDTGVFLITPQNMDDPASKDLIRPPFERYLKP
jgi:ribose transport system substrate-binding protein